MKGFQNPPCNLEELGAILTKAGLVKQDAVLDLFPYQPGFARRTAYRNAHYLVSSKQEAICHLVAGKNLAPLYARARDFSAACPKLACRPLLYHEGKGSTDYLCLEHFAGESLDVAVQSGRYSGSEWLTITRHAQELLDRTGQPSNPARLQSEIDSLLKDVGAFPGFSEVDSKLLLELARPILLQAPADVPLVQRWTTGDFAGRNLLVDAKGDLRLIDYDHAAMTHFGRCDWLRLLQFSVLPPGLDPASVTEFNFADRPRHEVYLWLHQLALLREAEPTEETKRHLASMVQNLFAAIDRASGRKSSFLIGSLLDRQVETESALEKRTVWAKSLEAELEKARAAFAMQAGVAEERSTWAKSLEQELGSARQNLEKLIAEHAERTAWAKSLEQDLHATRQNFEKLTAEYAERTIWAKSLDADLEKARAELAAVDKACNALAALFPGNSEKGRAALVERSLRALVDLQRDIAAKNAAINAGVAATLRAQLDSEVAESDAHRLAAALADAQLHVDGLLQHATRLQNSINQLQATSLETETALREKERLLNSSIVNLQATRAELSRYEGRLICRLAARPPSLPRASPS
jgi:hypothetical protein